jgi:hypothetical protein
MGVDEDNEAIIRANKEISAEPTPLDQDSELTGKDSSLPKKTLTALHIHFYEK